MPAMTGAQIVVDALVHQGVEVVFGYPGGCVLDIFDQLNKAAGLRFVLVRHEQGAGHMADGYARSCGRPGVALVTSGPGATNLVTALATAHMDSVPMIAISGQVPTHAIGTDAFQEADTVGITRPCTKHNFLVKDARDLARTIREAFLIATTGRPGPVLIDIPKDVQKQVVADTEWSDTVAIRSYNPVNQAEPRQVRRAAELLARAKRPLLYCGGGAVQSDCQAELIELAERCQIPVTTTLLGLGVFPETHPLALHMLGMHGTQYANFAMHHTDLIIALGARFDDRVTGKIDAFAPNREAVIHIDVDPASVSKCIPATVPLIGNCRTVLRQLLTLAAPASHPEWLEQVNAWKHQLPLNYGKNGSSGGSEASSGEASGLAAVLRPQAVIKELYDLTGGDAIITTEVGQHQMWAAHFWQYTRPRTFISSGGLGTMGYGFPAAIGAQIAHPDKLVVDIAGDGSIQMNIQELATAVMENLPVKVVILNNRYLGMVRQWQQMFYKHNYSGIFLGRDNAETGERGYIPDFVKLCEAYGAVGMRVDTPAQLRPALQEAIGNGRPTFIDCWVEEEENVWPMIPAGGSVEQMMSGE